MHKPFPNVSLNPNGFVSALCCRGRTPRSCQGLFFVCTMKLTGLVLADPLASRVLTLAAAVAVVAMAANNLLEPHNFVGRVVATLAWTVPRRSSFAG